MKAKNKVSPLLLALAGLAASPALAQGHNHGIHEIATAAASQPTAAQSPLRVPSTDVNLETLDLRVYQQIQSIWKFKVPYELRFTDQLAASGITFEHHATDDSLRDYKAVHYDHGTGVSAADVDGDGKTDLYFVNQLGGNELWKNLGGGRFQNITATAGVALKERVSVAAAFADIDNDGDQDLFVTTVKFGNALFENDGHGVFKDISKAAGVDFSGHSSAAFFFDYDKDGKLDLFVTNLGIYTQDGKGRGGFYLGLPDAFQGHTHPERTDYSILYRNLGGNKFADVTQATGLVDGGWSGDASFNDLNGDGWPDVYCLNMQGDNHFFLNQGGKSFKEATAEYFPHTSWGAMSIKFFDPDRDGDPDLYITDMHSDMSREVPPAYEKIKSTLPEHWKAQNNVQGNSYFENQGGKFVERSQQLNLENFWPWGFTAADFNADGWEDLFVTASMSYPFRYQVNSLLLNNGGDGFLDAEFLTGLEPRAGAPYRIQYELECSGEDSANKLCAGRTGRQPVYGSRGSRSSVIFDLEGDGDLDIVTGELNDVPMVEVSDLASRQNLHWITIQLRGKASNRDGLGAKVTVKFGGKASTQWHDGKSGYLGFSSLPLYFGLGESDKIDAVEVLWPSGARQSVTTGLAANRLLEIQEP